MPVTISGVLERILFSNEENGYLVGDMRREGETATVTITGVMPGVQCGETLEVNGQWVVDRKYGRQFKVKSHSSILPSTVHGIRQYLGSGLVPGIGRHFANKIVDYFGAKTFDIISRESARLREVPGIGSQRAQSIKKAWEEQSAIREVMVFLQTYGVSSNRCVRLVKRYGNQAKTILKNEPYRVAREMEGIGFKTADRIALNLGFGNESAKRLEAGLLFSLRELEGEGHTCMPRRQWLKHAAQLLETTEELLESRADRLSAIREVVSTETDQRIQLPESHRAEATIAEFVMRTLCAQSALPPIKVDIAIRWAQDKANFQFAEEQIEAIGKGLREKVSIITGGPGTGKTTILRALVQIVSAKKAKGVLAAPTGRAAQRLSATTGSPAKTIHRLLKFDPGTGRFQHDESNPLQTPFVILDEASMIDARLAASLFRAIPATAHIVLVGDVNQLPSVGAGNVLNDLILCGKIPVTRLRKIFRQHRDSSIISTAHNVLQGKRSIPYPVRDARDLDPEGDLQFIKATDPEKCVGIVRRLCQDFIPRKLEMHPLHDTQVLVPMHKGIAGIRNFNAVLQRALNPGRDGITFGSVGYRVGDKIIQNRNNYDLNVFNGDIGSIISIDTEKAALRVRFDNETVELTRSDLGDVSPAYAISVHKSQGSEYPIVVIPLMKQHYMMLQRNLLYTALTRGKQKIFLVGDPTAWFMAVNNADPAKRFTDLREKILQTNRPNP